MSNPAGTSLRLTKFDRFVTTASYNARYRRNGGNQRGEFVGTQFAAVAEVNPDTGWYERAYQAWKAGLGALAGTTLAAEFTVDGRMIVGIGQPNVLENSITLNRLWGTPFIPGSALKGLAHHYAGWVHRNDPATITADHLTDLFGTTEDGGLITFHDAWYVPGSAGGNPIMKDVITGHHGDWYQQKDHPVLGGGIAPPWDFTDPNPVSFLSARGRYLVAVQVDPGLPVDDASQAWAKAAMDILTSALEDWGIGAKTNAGYGRLVKPRPESLPDPPWVTAATGAEAYRAAIAALKDAIAVTPTSEITKPVAQSWATGWNVIEEEHTRDEIAPGLIRKLWMKPRVYLEVTGRQAPGQNLDKKGKLASYMEPLMAWLDAHPDLAPGGEPK